MLCDMRTRLAAPDLFLPFLPVFSAAGFLRFGFDLVDVAAMFLGCVPVAADAAPFLDLFLVLVGSEGNDEFVLVL